ncbi:MAG: cupredoxin domain-containing protein [Actinomycetota bacterium]
MDHSRRALFILILCLALVAVACGNVGENEPAANDSATGEQGDIQSSPASEIAIRGIAFVPATFEVDAGTEVTWVNKDPVDHTVTSGIQREQGVPGVEKDKPARPDGRFDESLPEQGDAFTSTFDEPGTYTYYCDVHAGMTGEIEVE